MSKQEMQPHHRPAASGPLSELRSIAVAQIAFREMLEIPGRLSSQGVKAERDATNRKRWRLSYVPQLHHHVMEVFLDGGDKPAGVYYVHESLVAYWVPAT